MIYRKFLGIDKMQSFAGKFIKNWRKYIEIRKSVSRGRIEFENDIKIGMKLGVVSPINGDTYPEYPKIGKNFKATATSEETLSIKKI